MELLPFVDLKAQYLSLSADVQAAMRRVLESTSFILGPDVAEFEKEFAAYCGAQYCVGVGSGTAALKLALEALDIHPGDEVIVPANTYIATALAVSQMGAKPVFVDMADDYLIDPDLMEQAISARTKAVILVHLYGRAIPDSTFAAVRKHRLKIIEDACQAHGAWSGERKVGALGDVGCFSFYPGKNLGAYGDGGAVVTHNAGIAERVRLLRDFGHRKKYEQVIKGDNSRLDTLQAAILRVKLPHLDRWNELRRVAATRYNALLQDATASKSPRPVDRSDVYHLYVIEVANRDRLQECLTNEGVQTGIHYPIPIHRQEAYADLNLPEGSFPRTEVAAKRLLSLPMFPEISEGRIERVGRAIHKHSALVRS